MFTVCGNCNGSGSVWQTRRWDGQTYETLTACDTCKGVGMVRRTAPALTVPMVTPSGETFYVTPEAAYGGPVVEEPRYDDWEVLFGQDDPNVKASEQYYGSVYR